MILSPERLVAYITFVWALVGVRALVYEQIVGLCELTLAKATYEFCLVVTCTYRKS